MKDEQIKELAKNAWHDYWIGVQISGLAGKFSDDVFPILETFFEAGYLEGYRNCEEKV